MKKNIDRKGSVTVLLSLLILAALVFVGVSFFKPYYRYNTLKSHAKDLLVAETGNQAGTLKMIEEKIRADAAELNIPLKEEDLSVEPNGEKGIKVKATWSEVVDFWGYYQKKLDFNMELVG